MSKKKRIDTSAPSTLKSSPFAGLGGGSGSRPVPALQPDKPAASGPPPPAPPKRAVVRYQRSGRGGKEVTLVERLGLAPAVLQVWLREIKKTLGCGGFIEGESLVFAGDQRHRLAEVLGARGVGKVTLS